LYVASIASGCFKIDRGVAHGNARGKWERARMVLVRARGVGPRVGAKHRHGWATSKRRRPCVDVRNGLRTRASVRTSAQCHY
jgi:hypothetical protein